MPITRHRLKSGLEVTVRPVLPSDARHIRDAIARADRQTIYQRFFTYHPPLNDKTIRRLAEVDYIHRLALVAEVDGEPVAIGRYESLSGSDDVEVAFAVDPRYHGHGIATLIGRTLIERATDQGKARVIAYHLADNEAAGRLLSTLGLVPAQPEHGVVESTMTLPAVNGPDGPVSSTPGHGHSTPAGWEEPAAVDAR